VFAEPSTATKAGKVALKRIRYRIDRKSPNVRLGGSNETRVSDTGMEASTVTYEFKVTKGGAADLATLKTWAAEDSETQHHLHGRFGIANTVNTAFDLTPSSASGLKVVYLHVDEDPHTGAISGELKLVLDGAVSGFA